MPTLAEIESRQRLSAQGESRVLALGQESGKPLGKTGETWVTATDTSDARTLADWVAVLKAQATNAVYPTLAAAQAARPVVAPDSITLLGYLAAGDGGRAVYKSNGTTNPSFGQGKFSLVTAGGVTTWYLLDEQTPNELMFGAVASASNADQTTAINNLLAFCRNVTPCRKAMIVASHTITDTIVVYSGLVVEFACPSASTGAFLTKGFNGDMMTMAGSAKIINCRLVGDGGNFTGRGIVISSGTNQILEDPDIQGMEGPCLEFTAGGAGARFKCYGGFFLRQTSTDPAIVGPSSELSTTGFRHFYGTHGLGGMLVDFQNGNYWMLTNCAGSVTFQSNSQRVIMTGCRVTNASPWQIAGTEHSISQCFYGGAVMELVSGASYCRIINNTIASGGNVTNNSGDATNVVDNGGIITGLQDPPGANPGTITGRASIYVDTSDGDLKIRFADGTVKTIVTDT